MQNNEDDTRNVNLLLVVPFGLDLDHSDLAILGAGHQDGRLDQKPEEEGSDHT